VKRRSAEAPSPPLSVSYADGQRFTPVKRFRTLNRKRLGVRARARQPTAVRLAWLSDAPGSRPRCARGEGSPAVPRRIWWHSGGWRSRKCLRPLGPSAVPTRVAQRPAGTAGRVGIVPGSRSGGSVCSCPNGRTLCARRILCARPTPLRPAYLRRLTFLTRWPQGLSESPHSSQVGPQCSVPLRPPPSGSSNGTDGLGELLVRRRQHHRRRPGQQDRSVWTGRPPSPPPPARSPRPASRSGPARLSPGGPSAAPANLAAERRQTA
jgi:hypothetical protein